MQLDVSVLQKARDYVGDEALGAAELLSLLRKARKQKHPDKFQDATAKKTAEEEFKLMSELIAGLDQSVQVQHAKLKPQEIIVFQRSHQLVEAEKAVDDLEQEIADLKRSNEHKADVIDRLEKKLAEKAKTELAAEDEALRKQYRPKKGELFTAGVLIALSLLVPLFSKIEEVSTWIGRYSPFPASYISNAVFMAFLAALAMALKKIFEAHYIGQRADQVCSPYFAQRFLAYVASQRSNEKTAYFTESEANFFISIEPTKLTRALGKYGFKGTSEQANSRLTTLFINTLLEKKLISISHAENLDRRFSICSRGSYF
jgi:hypothetical protein